MLFNSYAFLLFFPLVALAYFALPKALRTVWLLGASYYFYASWNPRYALLIATSTLLTYACGCLLGTSGGHARVLRPSTRRWVLGACLGANLGILVLFKYASFLLESYNFGAALFSVPALSLPFDLLLPVGISFYTFQALGYTLDVAAGRIPPERNLVRYALFVSFFPQLVAGPIERSGNLLRQIQGIRTARRPSYAMVVNGLVLMVWGLFQKMVIADRIALFVDVVYDSYWNYNATALIVASVLFAFQIYCDFASYSTIAIGAAQVLGFSLMENFNAPYLARSIAEFWSRWHISLSTWFRDYLYIPLGGNRRGALRTCRNLLITFLLSGLWHGASWRFVVWGLLHGVFLLAFRGLAVLRMRESARKAQAEKTGVPASGADATACQNMPVRFSDILARVVGTFVLVDFAWVFFRAPTLGDAVAILGRIITRLDPWALVDGSLYEIVLSRAEFRILFFALVLLFLVDCLREKTGLRLDTFLAQQALWFRWGAMIGMVLCIFVFGIYGPAYDAQTFLYFQF